MQKIIVLSCGIFILFITSIYAQKEDSRKKVDSTLVLVHGDGLFINLGNKEKTVLNFDVAIQTGGTYATYNDARGAQNDNRMSINLARIYLKGSFLNNKILLGFTRDFTGKSGVLEAWIGANLLNKHLLLSAGQKQTHTNNRLAMADERFTQVLDQTIEGTSVNGIVYGGLMHNFVGATRESGLFFETNFSVNSMRIYPSVSITTGEGQSFDSAQNNLGYKYGGRIDVLPLGDFKNNNAFVDADLYYEKTPKFGVGIAGSYNVQASHKTGAGTAQIAGVYDANGKLKNANYAKIVSDFIFKYRGFTLIGEYTSAAVKGANLYLDASATTKFTQQIASSKYNTGTAFNVQSSYVFKNKYVLNVRFSAIEPEFSVQESLIQKQQWYTVGINKYNKFKNLKIGINTTYVDNFNAEIKYNWYSNLAVQFTL